MVLDTGRIMVQMHPLGSPCPPSGRKTRDQLFSAGSALPANQVPAGTKEAVRRPASFVPAGTFRFPGHQPSTEVLGYFRSSLRDCARGHRPLQETGILPEVGRGVLTPPPSTRTPPVLGGAVGTPRPTRLQPSGRKKIAQHFSAGSASAANQVPSGTKDAVRRPASVVPAGTFRFEECWVTRCVSRDSRQPQRGCVLQPRVARNELPWVGTGKLLQPQRGCGIQPPVGRNPVGVVKYRTAFPG